MTNLNPMAITRLPFLYIIIFLLADISFLKAQEQITITGKVIESNGGSPIAFATILVAENGTKTPITGTTTVEDGSFLLETTAVDFYIEVSFMGYSSSVFDNPTVVDGTIDLGTISLTEASHELDEVVVTGEVSQTVFKLDKRVFNVGKELANTGASALEVLNNVPSVSVNMEGQISLRGSTGVQVLINGKPTVLTSGDGNALGTITSDMVESVEVITNPSAKYEASGTSGIINIILKKDEKKGLNGAITLNTGIPNNHSLGVSINRRTERWNLFGQLGIGHRTFPERSTTVNRSFVTDTVLRTLGKEEHHEKYYLLNLGADYHASKSDVITLSGRYAMEYEDTYSDFEYERGLYGSEANDRWKRDEDTEADNPKFEYELQYSKDFNDNEEHNLIFSALGSYFRKKSGALYQDQNIIGTTEDRQQRMESDYTLSEYTLKLDYVWPLTPAVTLEAGSQYVITNVNNDYEVLDQEGMEWVTNPNFTNIFDFAQNVLGIYTTAAYENDKWGVKLGLRMEDTSLNTLLVNNDQANEQDYNNLFPSVHTSYTASENLSFQLGYSARINRPSLWDLNPFYSIRNLFDIYTGNPYLQPEFTDSYEAVVISRLGPVNLNFSTYYRYTTDVVEMINEFVGNTSIVSPMNIGRNKTTGLEVNAKYASLNWMTINLDANYNHFNRDGEYDGTSFDFKGNQWDTKLLTKFRLPADLDLEFTGNYESEFKTLQYTMRDNLYLDMGARKKIIKGKVILNLSVRDVFASRRYSPFTITDTNSKDTNQRNGRFVTFGISYGFGKGEAMEFSGQKMF